MLSDKLVVNIVLNSTRRMNKRTNERTDKHVVQHVVGLLASRPWVMLYNILSVRSSSGVWHIPNKTQRCHDNYMYIGYQILHFISGDGKKPVTKQLLSSQNC